MTKARGSFISGVVRFPLSCVGQSGRCKVLARAASVTLASLVLAGSASAVTDTSWKGATSADWSVASNWTFGVPDPTLTNNNDNVVFDDNSIGFLSTTNDISSLVVRNLVTIGTPTGNVSVNGSNTLTISPTDDRGGILMGGGATPIFTIPAQVDMAVNVNLIIGADQSFQTGGPSNRTVTIGANATNTIDLNGKTLTIRNVSNSSDMMIVNSSIIDSSNGSGLVKYDKGTTANINVRQTRIRLGGNSTYSSGTTITSQRQNFQLTNNSVTSGGSVVSGPFGTGTITVNTFNGNSVNFQPYGADRTLDNDITLNGSIGPITARPVGAAAGTGDTKYTMTLNGTINVPGIGLIVADNGDVEGTGNSDGSGDLIVNGDVHLNSGVAAIFTTGAIGNATPTRPSGKIIYNGSILQTSSNMQVSVANGIPAFPATVRFNGQNTYNTTNLSAAGATTSAGDAGIQIGSSSILDGGGVSVVSGPLGKGTLTFNNGGNTPRIEAYGAARTVANDIFMASSGYVQGSQDLTLTGTILNSTGGLIKTGTGKLTLATRAAAPNGQNAWTGSLTVINGTLSVPSIDTAGTAQPLGRATSDIALGGTSGSPSVAVSGTLEYTGSADATLGRQITLTAGGTGGTLRATSTTGTGLTLAGGGADSVNTNGKPITFDGDGNISVTAPISGTGGRVIKTGNGTLALTGNNTYTGDTRIQGGVMNINTRYLADGADVYLSSGSTFGLNFAVAQDTDDIRSLYIDNVLQADGTWGAPGSGATHTSSLLAGIGWLNAAIGAVVDTLPGDFNNDGKVDAGDYATWRKQKDFNPNTAMFHMGTTTTPIGQAQFDLWRQYFGTSAPAQGSSLSSGPSQVPEPTAFVLFVIGAILFSPNCVSRRRKNRR